MEADEAIDVEVTDLLQGGVDELFQVNVCITVVLRHSYPISSFSPCDEDALGKLWDHHCFHSSSKSKSMEGEVVVVVVDEFLGILQHVLCRGAEVLWERSHVALSILDLENLAHRERSKRCDLLHNHLHPLQSLLCFG